VKLQSDVVIVGGGIAGSALALVLARRGITIRVMAVRLAGLEVTMRQLFAVIRTRGPAWQESRPLESQADWASHASFMNALAREGLVILGGPLEDTPDVLLVMRAETPDEIRSCLDDDPWSSKDLLRISRIAPWTLRLGSLG